MGFISIDIRCIECDHKWDDIVPREDQENFFVCPECGHIKGKKTISTPMVMKASYPDGKKRFTDLKEAAKLKKIKAKSGGEERKRIANEIRKIGVKQYE